MTALLMLGSVLRWLTTTTIGRWIGVIGIVLLLLVIAFFKVKAMGRSEEHQRIVKATDKLVKAKEKLDADVSKLSDDELDRRLRRATS